MAQLAAADTAASELTFHTKQTENCYYFLNMTQLAAADTAASLQLSRLPWTGSHSIKFEHGGSAS